MYQFRLSTLLIAITVLAVYCAIPGMFGVPEGVCFSCTICVGLCAWFWKKILWSKFLLSGDTTGEAVIRLMVGVVAGGSLFGESLILTQSYQENGWNLNSSYESVIFFALFGAVIGAVLSALVVFFVGVLTSLLYEIIERPWKRVLCSSCLGAIVVASCPLLLTSQPVALSLSELSLVDLSFLLLLPAFFGAIGGGLPELLKIRYDRWLAEEAEASVPRETTGEVDWSCLFHVKHTSCQVDLFHVKHAKHRIEWWHSVVSAGIRFHVKPVLPDSVLRSGNGRDGRQHPAYVGVGRNRGLRIDGQRP